MRQMDIWAMIGAAHVDAAQVDALVLDAEFNGRATLTDKQRAEAEARARETLAALRMLEDAGRADVAGVLREAIRTQVRSYTKTRDRNYFHRQLYGPVIQLRSWRGGNWRDVYVIWVSGGVMSYRDVKDDDLGAALMKLNDPELLRVKP